MGKWPASESSTERPGRSRDAAISAPKSCTDVESPTTVCPGAAPTSAPTRSPRRWGVAHQPLSSQPATPTLAHCSSTAASTASRAARGWAPRELPAR